MINTIIVEDNKYIQQHFANLIADDERFHLADVVSDAFEAEKLCYKGIDLVLMDVLTLHRHSGLAAGRRIKEKSPKTKVVIITSLIDPDILAKAKQAVLTVSGIKITAVRSFWKSLREHCQAKGFFRIVLR